MENINPNDNTIEKSENKTEYKNWNESLTEDDISLYFHKNFNLDNENENDNESDSNPYKYDIKINSKLFLINENIILNYNSNFQIDALILQIPKNSKKTQSNYRLKIIQECGPKILDELKQTDPSLSESIITNSYSLTMYKKLIHIVLPKYNLTYSNACESSLHLSVRNILDTSIQNNFKSILLGYELLTPNKNFPVMSAITIVCRTTRKCLEKICDMFDKIVFMIEDKELFNKFRDNFKMYFPRNKSEEKFYAKFLPNIMQTEYGDIIIPERYIKIKTDFSQNMNNCALQDEIRITNKSVEGFYMDEDDDIRNYKIYRDDNQRIKESVLNSNDFAKQFFFENTKQLTDNLNDFFDNFNFIQFKGSDILKRQIFFIYLNKIKFYDIDNDHLIHPLIIYLYKCKLLNIFTNLVVKNHLKQNQRISFIVFCDKIERKHFPTIYLIKTLNNILISNSVKKVTNLDSNEVIFFQPFLMLKMFIYMMRIYIDKEIWKGIGFCSTFESLNKKYFFELDEDYNIQINTTPDLSNSSEYSNIKINKKDSDNISIACKRKENNEINSLDLDKYNNL